MVEPQKGGRGRSRTTAAVSTTEAEEARTDEDSRDLPTTSISPPSESQLGRLRLRERWELASVIHFLHVFQPIIKSDLEISAEEIETALISPNNALAELHINLLRGIPPVSKGLTSSYAWITAVCKKIALWWPWVAEGEVPLTVARGEEVSRYKELDPTVRLLILKALCEIRAEQYDIAKYIDDALKCGTQLSTFRKDKIVGDRNGIAYWYDGDSVLGHRLYKEIYKFEPKQRLKGRVNLRQPTINFQWETLATNLEEFREISDKLLSSKLVVESAVGKTVKNDIIPILEQLQKKKERALKRQQRRAIELDAFPNSFGVWPTRTHRDRKAVSYTFDEFDRSIEEAIQMSQKMMTFEEQDIEGKHRENGSCEKDAASRESLHEITNGDKYRGDDDDDNDDSDYDDGKTASSDDDCDDGDDEDDGIPGSSDKENHHLGQVMLLRDAQKQRDFQPKSVMGLRRSMRTAVRTGNQQTDISSVVTGVHDGTKKRLRQRPTSNVNSGDILIVSSSEDYYSDEVKDSEDDGTQELVTAPLKKPRVIGP